jgi:phosphate-selective porin OprO and OprP
MIGGSKTTSRYLLAGASVIGLLAIGVPEAKAQNMQEIQAQIDQMQATIKALQKQVQDAKAQASAAQTTADSAKGSDIDLKVAWKGAPQFSSADGKKWQFKIRGRVEAEYENIDQDTAVTTFPDVSATQLRRARLGVEGVAWYDVKYILEVDFANDVVAVKDAYLQYQGVKIGDTPLYFRAGNFRTPTSFELLTSELFVDTVERAAFVNAWQLDRQIGFQVSYWTDHWGLAAGIFGDRFNAANNPQPLFTGFTGDEDVTFAARATVAPINRQVNGVNQVLHFGASVRTREIGDDQPLLQYTQRGADFNLANNVINTGRIGDEDTFWGLEAATLWGPFSLQGEYSHLDVDLPTGPFIGANPPAAGLLTTALNPFISSTGVRTPSPEYNGWYVTGTWFFGGHKNYNKEGKWDRPTIDNPMRWNEGKGWGAIELVGKYDVLNMSDQAFNDAGVNGCPTTRLFPNLAAGVAGTNPTLIAPSVGLCGEQRTWIVGVNWYLNDYVRLMFDYAEADLSGYPLTTITATNTTADPGDQIAGFDGGTIRGFTARAQIDW